MIRSFQTVDKDTMSPTDRSHDSVCEVLSVEIPNIVAKSNLMLKQIGTVMGDRASSIVPVLYHVFRTSDASPYKRGIEVILRYYKGRGSWVRAEFPLLWGGG